MSAVGFRAVTDEIATGTSEKTLLQVVAASNHRVTIHEWSISFKGTSNTEDPILIQVLKQTSAGTMTSLTLVKANDNDDETLEVTAQHTATAEPTSGDVLDSLEVHPQTGFVWQARYGDELIIPGGDRLGWTANAATSVSSVTVAKGTE